MKKPLEKIYHNKTILLSLIVLGIALTGILLYLLLRCKHDWKEATCTESKICILCDKKQGDPLGHTWKKANCTTPKTCNTCGVTEGKPLGHTWEEATCTAPKTCSVCEATEGEPLGHQWVEATCTAPRTCDICGETTGETLDHEWYLATCVSPKTCRICGTTEGGVSDIHYLALSEDGDRSNVMDKEPKCKYCGKTMAVRLSKGNWQNYLSIQFTYDNNAKKITSYSQVENLPGAYAVAQFSNPINWDWNNIYTYGLRGSITITPLKDNIKFVRIDTDKKLTIPCIITNLSYDGSTQMGTDWSNDEVTMSIPIDENGYGRADIIFPCGLQFDNGINDSRFPKSQLLKFSDLPSSTNCLAISSDLKWEIARKVDGLP